MKSKGIFHNLSHSLGKQFRKIQGKYFVYEYSKRIKLAIESNKAEVDLDEIFPDNRAFQNTKIEKIKHIATKILFMIDHLSKKNDFSYMLSYGSLLGAIRHKGFIPWDDDLDIMMTRKDLNKLISVCQNFPSSIKFYPVGNNFVKVMDKYSKISFDGLRGVAIDIFVLDDEKNGYSFINVHNQKRIYLSSKDIFPLRNQKFESSSFPIPHASEAILTKIYGDYMVLPPIEDRVYSHSNEESVLIYDYPN